MPTVAGNPPFDARNPEQLQAYLKERRQDYIQFSKPGYEIYFYSRFDENSQIIPTLTLPNNLGQAANNPKPKLNVMADNGDTSRSYITTSPTLILTSDLSRNDVAVVTNISVNNTVSDIEGSRASIQLVEPVGINFFVPTIGDDSLKPLPGWDYSEGASYRTRIGWMDTVIIKLKNVRASSDQLDSFSRSDVVFRGVISQIIRTKSAGEGKRIQLELRDFSHWMRQITALPIGIFSTVAFDFTGRGLSKTLVAYTNKIYTGDWTWLGIDYTDIFANQLINSFAQAAGITKEIQNNFSGGPTNISATDTTGSGSVLKTNTNHAMDIPPFLYLEFTGPGDPNYIDPQAAQNYYNTYISGSTVPFPGGNSVPGQAASNDLFTMANQFMHTLPTLFQNWAATNNPGNQTPEDKESINVYAAAAVGGEAKVETNKNSGTNQAKQFLQDAEKFAWIYSDLYLDKLIQSFEHEKPWNVVWQAANRSLREVYFDFAPKINPAAVQSYHTALVTDIKQNPNLPDIHPNIGILKYRLSPCLIPYNSQNENSLFRMFSINESQVIREENLEREDQVYTAVYGFGTSLDNDVIEDATEALKQLAAGQSKGLFVFAHTIDPTLERRIGYRFMSDHDNKIRTPFLSYLTSYVLLVQSQMSGFSCYLTVNGNPAYQAGSIVRLKEPNIDYYCFGIKHDWSIEQGFKTDLLLSHGRTSGFLPPVLTGGILNDFIANNQQCITKSTVLEPYIPKSTKIGTVNVHCLISALWSYMTCASTENLSKMTPEYENSKQAQPTNFADWINYVGGVAQLNWNSSVIQYPNGAPLIKPTNFKNAPIASFASQFKSRIAYYNLEQYGVSVNLLNNLIAAESSWNQNAVNPTSGALGLFQLLSPNPIGNAAVTDINSALEAALQNLREKMQIAFNGRPQPWRPEAFLRGLENYGEGTPEYAIRVLGQSQYDNIKSGGQVPSNAQFVAANSSLPCATQTSANLKAWPFKVYGPIGMRLDAAQKYFKGQSASQLKNSLLKFQSGMPLSVEYITILLKHYLNNTLPPATNFNGVDETNLLQKTLAAWYSNETPENVDNSQLIPIMGQIEKLYQECINCTGQITPSSNVALNAAAGRELLNGIGFIYPIHPICITSGYGPRNAPITQDGGTGSSFHFGIDMEPPDNQSDPFVATANGTIFSINATSRDGNIIALDHGKGIFTIYIDVGQYSVSVGQTVTQGQVIGKTGNPPGATAYHVHFEIRTGCNGVGTGQTVNPADYCK